MQSLETALLDDGGGTIRVEMMTSPWEPPNFRPAEEVDAKYIAMSKPAGIVGVLTVITSAESWRQRLGTYLQEFVADQEGSGGERLRLPCRYLVVAMTEVPELPASFNKSLTFGAEGAPDGWPTRPLRELVESTIEDLLRERLG